MHLAIERLLSCNAELDTTYDEAQQVTKLCFGGPATPLNITDAISPFKTHSAEILGNPE